MVVTEISHIQESERIKCSIHIEQNWGRKHRQHIVWHDDVIIKQLISYAVVCMLGRYLLDKPRLHIAHPNPTDEGIAPYEDKGEQWTKRQSSNIVWF